MRRRSYLKTAGALTAGTVLSGCVGGGDTGTLVTRVRDQPGDIDDFETLVLRITKLYPKPVDGDRTTVDIDDVDVDLVEFQGGEGKSLGATDLETGEYEFLQLEVGEVVDAVLKEGGDARVTTPGEAPLKFETSFEIRADETTTFVADFTPVKRGRTSEYVLKPVADGVEVRYDDQTST